MKTLKLVLKKKWFDMIASGEKKEEYREIKPFWEKRLIDYKGLVRDFKEIAAKRVILGIYTDPCKEYPRGFEAVTFYLGYAKDRPAMTFEVESIQFGKGKPEWGAEPGKDYFVIKLGDRID